MNTRFTAPFSLSKAMLAFVGWVLLIKSAFGLAPPGYSSRLWQLEDGLPHTIVQAIAQTTDGYLWIGTREGLARFDGERFSLIELSPEITHPNIWALCAARDGSLWIGAEYLGLFHMTSNGIVRIPAPSGTLNYGVLEIQETRTGELWVNSSEGVTRLRNGKLELFPGIKITTGNSVSIAAAPDGTMWFVSNGVKHYDGQSLTNYPGRNLPGSARKLYCGRDGTLWAGINSGVIRVRDGNGTSFRKEPGPGGYVSVILEDRDGKIWAGTYLGLSQLVNGEFVSQSENEEASYRVFAVFQDQERNIWVGSEEGLTRLTPKRFASYTKRQGLTHNNVVSVYPHRDGGLWIGVWGTGINFLKDDNITVYNHTNGLVTDYVMALCEGHDACLWIGTDGGYGLHRLKDGKISRLDKLPGWKPNLLPVITALAEDHNGALWAGTRDGVYRLQDEKFTHFTTKDGLIHDKLNAICEGQDGTVWMGTDGGISGWTNGGFHIPESCATHLRVPVLSLYEDKEQTLWIGTKEAGLARLCKGKLDRITSRQGLFSDSIYSILEDDRRRLWLNTSKGIFQVNKAEVVEVMQGLASTVTSITYGKTDGIVSSGGQYREVTQPASCKTTDGRMWFRTTLGVAVVDPEKITANPLPPPVLIQEVVADRQSVWKDLSAGSVAPEVLTIAPGRGELEIRYTALSYQASEKNRFRYQLEGADQTWVEAGDRRVAYYNKLTPMTYRFRVIACNNDGVWNEVGTTMTLVLRPHFWQTWWFLGLVTAACMGMIAGIARYITRRRMQIELDRLERRHALERERSRIARDIHDDLGARVTRIMLLSENVGKNDCEETRTSAQKIADTSREMAQSLDEIVWAVNPAHDTLEGLVEYLSQSADEFLQETNIRLKLNAPEELPAMVVSAEVRYQLFLAFREALNNAVKHSGATEMEITLSATDGRFEIIVKDNGRGFEPGRPVKRGEGLKNMHERMQRIGGEFEINSLSGHGTRVRLSAELTSPHLYG